MKYMISQTTIGIITILYNSDEVLRGFMKSVANQSYKNIKIYFIDNSPNSETHYLLSKLLREYHLDNKSTYKSNIENIGFAKANNYGIKLAIDDGCEYVILANNDIEFYEKDFFSNLIQNVSQSPIITPKILYKTPYNLIWYAGGYINSFTGLAKMYGHKQKDSKRYSKNYLTDFAPACFLFVKSSVFLEVGLFDENFFVYFEDADWCLRCNKLGLRVLVMGSECVYHKVSHSSGGKHSPVYVRLMSEGRLYFIYKNFKGLSYLTAMSLAIIITLVRLLFYSRIKRSAVVKGTIVSAKKIFFRNVS